MTPLQYIKDRVREVCPEIMKLKFGCEILYMPKERTDIFLNGGEIFNVWNSSIGSFTEESKFYKILGSPIGLAEILRTIDESSIVIEAKTGQFGEETPEGVLVGGFPIWNLEKTLDEQDTQTVEFIASILGYDRNN